MKAFTPLAAVLAASILAGGQADAQVRVRGGVRVGTPRARVSVVVGRPYYYGPFRPYYRSYRPLYAPFYFSAFYGSYPYYYRPYYYGYSGYPYGSVAYAGYAYAPFDGGAAVRLQVTPRDTEVYIDNYYAGTVDDFDGMFQRLHVEPGAHDITLYRDGFRTVRQRIYLQPTGTFRLRYDMMPLAPGEAPEARPATPPPPPSQGAPSQAGPNVYPPPGYPQPPSGYPPPPSTYPPPAPAGGAPAPPQGAAASLSIRVQPVNAEVLIDGERWDGSIGDERLVVQVAPGVHHIEVRRDGYRSYQTDITVRPGETSTVNISLTRQP